MVESKLLLNDGSHRIDFSGKVGWEKAERLAVVGGQRRTISFKVAWDGSTGGARTVTQGFNAALSLQLCSRSADVPTR